MCLAIPGQVVEIHDDRLATVNLGGITRRVSLDLLENVAVGDWVAVHVGFAISKLDEAEARETLDLLRRIALATGDPEEMEELGLTPEAGRSPALPPERGSGDTP